MRFILALILLLCLPLLPAADPVPLGTEGAIQITCANKPLDIIYSEDYPPLQLRIVKRELINDEQQRVTLAWVSNRAGTYTLSDFLHYTDGSQLEVDAEMTAVEAFGILPENHDGAIHSVAASYNKPGLLYSTWLKMLGGLWAIGLIGLIIVTRGRRRKQTTMVPVVSISLAEHLRKLLRAADNKRISDSERATIERLIYTYWQRKLGLQKRPVQEAIPAMRADTEAGSALRDLDALFHRPDAKPDIDQVLAPYRQCSLAELET